MIVETEIQSSAGNTASAPIVAVENLRVSFGRPAVEVVRGISFEIARGECLAIVGESGSGKSVTSRALVGLAGFGAQVTFDRLDLDGESIATYRERQWRRIRGAKIGFVLQDALSSLDALRAVGDEIAEPLKLHTDLSRSERAAKAVELLRLVGVPEPELRVRQFPHELSGGLRQRALIASAIACDPELLVADEPTTALDVTIQAEIMALLESLRTDRTGQLVVSHDLAVVARLADRVAVMQHGEFVEIGPTEEILGSPSTAYTKQLLAAIPSAHTRGIRLFAPTGGGAAGQPNLRRSASRGAERDHLLLEGAALKKSYKGPDGLTRTVVDDVSFSLGRGEALGLVGESGSGKTTTARLALGLEKLDSGELRWLGTSLDELSASEVLARRRRFQFVYQDPLTSFDPRFTVAKVIGEAVGIAGVTGTRQQRRRTLELLELVHLGPEIIDRRPIEMSGGQRQRVAIARALAPEPDVLVLDEPVSALDVSVQARILDLLVELRSSFDVAYLFISHDLGVVYHLCDRIIVMREGKVVEIGDIEEVFGNPKDPYTQNLLAAVPRLENGEALRG